MHLSIWIALLLAAVALYPLSVRYIGRPLAISSWNAWQFKRPGKWTYFLFPESSRRGLVGHFRRYGYGFNPNLVEIATGFKTREMRDVTFDEGHASYIAQTAAVWPLKLLSCALVWTTQQIIIVTHTLVAGIYDSCRQVLYRLSGVA